MLSYDTWSLQTWLGGLSKMALCQIITTTAMKCPRVVLEMIEEYQPNKNDFYHRREILAIRERAHIIIHSLDHLRPSEQFANEADLAEEIHCVVRWCTNTLHASPRGHSLAALMGLLVIAREGLAAVPEIRKYLFGEAHLGRIVILEMSGVLKNFKKPTTIHQHAAAEYLLPNQWSFASPHHQVTWLIQSLGDVCAQMADCDKGWTYRQEYDNVVNIAARNYCHPSP
ncbi:hypothetical protein BDA99DRAFT_438037 [Phascolomyces articulosus]|uniref:Uncharacterized protein n=1 Tax=Phascolomyces articulosus TaxID=60185 RepID=A0AAD5K9N8_9FUNG|nr:hypothetical protein BDA99DRAFT_438037 [Phascolomyces articulosus]